jgi:GTPase SAR1 family protein
MSKQKIEISELDPEILLPLTSRFEEKGYMGGFKMVVIGKPGTGKSTLIKSLLYSKKHIFPAGIVMSGTEDTNHNYKKFMPESFIYNDYDEKVIESFIKRQKLATEYLPNPWAVMIIDDCTDDPKIFNKPIQHALYKKGRNWKMWYLLSLQYAMDIKPAIRTSIDGAFILREPLLKNRKILYENYASIVPDFSTFCDLMDQLTDDHHAIYIHNMTTTNDWHDCVYYWKAPMVPDTWKFGSEDYHAFHNERFNPEFVQSF